MPPTISGNGDKKGFVKGVFLYSIVYSNWFSKYLVGVGAKIFPTVLTGIPSGEKLIFAKFTIRPFLPTLFNKGFIIVPGWRNSKKINGAIKIENVKKLKTNAFLENFGLK